MTSEDDSSLRLGARSVAAYVAGCVVLAGIWGSAHTSGAGHDALLVITGLLFLYLLYLTAIYLFVVGFAAWIDRLDALARFKHRDRRVPMAWWLVLIWWVLGVVGAILVTWVTMGVRGQEARWLIGSYLVGGLVVAAVFGKAGWNEKRATSRAPGDSARHRGS